MCRLSVHPLANRPRVLLDGSMSRPSWWLVPVETVVGRSSSSGMGMTESDIAYETGGSDILAVEERYCDIRNLK